MLRIFRVPLAMALGGRMTAAAAGFGDRRLHKRPGRQRPLKPAAVWQADAVTEQSRAPASARWQR
jgi:hypothetical protein